MKDLNDYTRKDFESLPYRGDFDSKVECDSIVILPMRYKHDSGYRCMDFVAVKNGNPVCRCSGRSDILHINGVGGYGVWKGFIPKLIPPVSWTIDCLRKSGLLQVFCREKISVGLTLSSMEIFAIGKDEEKENG